VAEFAHLNPWHEPEGVLDPACMESNREIVYVDLTWDEERIWRDSLSSDCRRQTKQSQRADVKVRRAESPEDVREFHRLYAQTMQRRDAQERYQFPIEYFLEFYHSMSENAFYVLAEYEGRVVAGGLFFEDRTNVYWHLSAADMEFAQVRPVNAYLFETIRCSLGRGKRRMVLGGGYQPDDGVFRFKANFSRLRERFCTYKRVHDAETYTALTQAWSERYAGHPPQTGFFPSYRSALPAEVQSPLLDREKVA
jgi:lipid II:glycine glycyltransferase (peptidoglycan interpeptide bridge formation enzyme)